MLLKAVGLFIVLKPVALNWIIMLFVTICIWSAYIHMLQADPKKVSQVLGLEFILKSTLAVDCLVELGTIGIHNKRFAYIQKVGLHYCQSTLAQLAPRQLDSKVMVRLSVQDPLGSCVTTNKKKSWITLSMTLYVNISWSSICILLLSVMLLALF